GDDALAAAVLVAAYLAEHDQQFVVANQTALRIVQLVVDRDVHRRAAVVQRDEHHLAATGHLRALRRDDTRDPDRLRGRLQVGEPRAHEAAHFGLEGVEQVAAQEQAERALLLLQSLPVAPGGRRHPLRRARKAPGLVAEQAHLV